MTVHPSFATSPAQELLDLHRRMALIHVNVGGPDQTEQARVALRLVRVAAINAVALNGRQAVINAARVVADELEAGL